MKQCITCQKLKKESEYYPHPRFPDKTINSCKECIKKRSRKNQIKNKQKRKKYLKEYREKNKDRLLEYGRKRDVKKRATDNLYRLRYNLSHRLRESIKRFGCKNSSVWKHVGCNKESLIEHLNNNSYGFVYGDDNIDIDHIVPVTSAKNREDMLNLYHFSNLQLLPSYYNRHVKKDNSFDKQHFEEWLKEQQ